MRKIIILTGLLLFDTVVVFAQPGALNKNFGQQGKVTTPFGVWEDVGRKAAIQPDGKIIQTGYSLVSGVGAAIAVVRYNQDGSLDSTFNKDGKVTTFIRRLDDEGYDVAIQKDGKIVVGGISYSNNDDADFAVVRYNIDGTLDTTFSQNGKVITSLGEANDACYSLLIQPDGKIVAAGFSYQQSKSVFALVRYNINGSLDKSFGNGGIVRTTVGNYENAVFAISLQADGKIVAVGISSTGDTYDFAVARYNTDGSLDKSFNKDGKVTTAVGPEDDVAYALAIQRDGKIIVAGRAFNNNITNIDFALVRYNCDGSLDKSFDNDGKVFTSIGVDFDAASSVAIQPDNKIVAAGISSSIGFNDDFSLVRYNVNGSLDSTFDYDGKVSTDFSQSNDEVSSVLFTPEGKIVAAGSSYINASIFSMAEYNSYWDVRNITGLYDETQYGCYSWSQSYPEWTDFIEYDASTSFNYYLGMQTQSQDSLGQICGYQSLVYPGNNLRENYTWDGTASKKLVGYLRRNFKFTFTNKNLTHPVGIRLYVTTEELNKFVSKFNNRYGTSYTSNDVYIIRYDGANQDTDLKNNSDNRNNYQKILPKLRYYGFHKEYAYFEFYTDHFSEFQIALSVKKVSPQIKDSSIAQSNDMDALNNTNSDIIIFPNPVSDILHVKLKSNTTLHLLDLSGKILLTQNISGSGLINVSHLPTGLYFLKNNATGKIYKVVIAR
jgi:uncharacterized delta-60 repeat protein